MPERDIRDLVGDDVGGDELERLRRVHELLVAAGPPPELSPTLKATPRVGGAAERGFSFSLFGQRRLGAALVFAAALLLIAFGAGYLAGHTRSGFHATHTVLMRGTSGAPNALASIRVGRRDAGGNLPMILRVEGLPRLAGRQYYELFLTRRGRAVASCGTFNTSAQTEVRLSVPYQLEGYMGWVVTRERIKAGHPGPWVMRTARV
jgi:hypothetical protein